MRLTTTTGLSLLLLVAAASVSACADQEEESTNVATAGLEETTWVRCATENEFCSFSGTRRVRYGTETTNVTRSLTGGTPCTNAVFGDPLYGTLKSCWYEQTTSTPPPSPTPTPTTPPPPPPTGAAIYFSDCQTGAAAGCVPGSDTNPGTAAAPRRTLAGINVNTLAAGTRLLFARGGAWNWTNLRLENDLVTPTSPLVFDAYGSGPLPLFRAVNLPGSAIDFGTYNNTSHDGGYTIRNIRIDGTGTSLIGLFLIHNLRNVTIENTELTGFEIAIHAQAAAPHGVHHVTIRNNSISRNGSMGILGQFSDSVIEGNVFERNNFSGSAFNHAIYLSGNAAGGRNNIVRNNRFLRNSVVNGVCQGGNFTMHGQMDGLLIEGNLIEQDAAGPGCWGISITQGYDTAEWFRNFVVRNNRIVNVGNTAINAQSAPGIIVEGNVINHTQNTYQTAIGVGHNEFQGGDVPDANAIVRNNTACYTNPVAGSSVVRVTSPGSQVTNNQTITGAAATTGVCAR